MSNAAQCEKKRWVGYSWNLIFPCLAAVFYTLSNICMKRLAISDDADQIYIVALRESVAFLVGLCVIGYWKIKKQLKPMPLKPLGILLGASVITQLYGNLVSQYTYQVVGIAVSSATQWGGLLLWTPLAGWFFLKEKISLCSSLALGIVAVAIILLLSGVGMAASHAKYGSDSIFLTLASIFLALGCGVVFSCMNTAIRYASHRGVPFMISVVILPGTGAILLTLSSVLLHPDVNIFTALKPEYYFWALSAGMMNMFAFLALTYALSVLDITRVTIINSAQIAGGAILGVLLFQEPLNWGITAGILGILTGIGLANLSPR